MGYHIGYLHRKMLLLDAQRENKQVHASAVGCRIRRIKLPLIAYAAQPVAPNLEDKLPPLPTKRSPGSVDMRELNFDLGEPIRLRFDPGMRQYAKQSLGLAARHAFGDE